MRIFLETATVSEVKEASALGLVDGVILNQSLVAEAGKSLRDLVIEISELINGPICVECLGTSQIEFVETGRELASWHKNVVLKLPLQGEALKAIKILTEEAIGTNVTLCSNAPQALLAAKAGATYLCPVLEQLEPNGAEDMVLIRDIRQIFDNYGFETQIILPITRVALQISEAARLGVDVITAPFSLLQQILPPLPAAKGSGVIVGSDYESSSLVPTE